MPPTDTSPATPSTASPTMPPPTALLTHRTDYRPWPFALDRLDLHVELGAELTRVRNRMHLRRRPDTFADSTLRLDGIGLEPIDLRVNGVEIAASQWSCDAEGISIEGLPAEFELDVSTLLKPRTNRSGSGLFELQGQLATQCEPQGLRHITYCPDRPDVLARYRVTLVADAAAYPLLLCNGNRVSSQALPGGRHEVTWDDPFPKPSYIFAMVAGNLACLSDSHVTPSGCTVQLGIYAEPRFIQRCRFAMDALKRAMRWDEATYGLECDLDDYKMVALSGFVGAMENKGLNLFDISGILADPEITTDDEALTIERIIAHEYFHNWTGNRVTCRDWFQLSLKEGLTRFRDQRYIEDLLGGGTYRVDTVRLLQRNQFPEDDGPERHPVRPEEYANVEQFYTPTVYEKGAELIRMLHTLLGAPVFHEGVALYLRLNDGKAVTTDDFVAAMEQASGRDLAQFRRWYTQAGRPRLSVQHRHDPVTRQYALTLSQTLPVMPQEALPAPFHIPVVVRLLDADGSGGQPGEPRLLELTQATQTFRFEGVAEAPLPSLLEGLSAPVSVEDFLDADALAALMSRASDPYSAWNAGQTLLVRLIRELAAAHHVGGAMVVPDRIVDAFGAVLSRATARRMLTAELLRIPDEPMLSEGLARIDLDGHAAARDVVRATLAKRLRRQLLACIDLPADTSRALMDADAMAARRLSAVCLQLLLADGESASADLALYQVMHGATMTERHAALTAIVDHDGPQREQALAAFIERWRDQPTVVAKWFTAQALSRLPGTVDRVIALESHPAFSMDDITQLMALHGSFFRQNRIAFHDPSGRGYSFLADRLLLSDRMGRAGTGWLLPQIAQWRRHEPKRQALMRAQLERVLYTPDISNGLKGLMLRALNETESSS